MKMPGALTLSREARVALAAAILTAAGAIGMDRGWYTAGIALWFVAGALTAALYLFFHRPSRVPRDVVLTIRLADGLREVAPRSPLDQLRGRGAANLFQVRSALAAAATDLKVKTVLVEIGAPGVGLATAQELHDLLRALVSAGKRVVAILSGDQVTIRDYLIACGAGEIVVNPDSAILMLGMATGSVFLKNALARVGIEAQTLQWKEYKGAGETFSRDSMSPELRESLRAIVADWRTIVAGGIAAARKLSVERVEDLLGAGFMSTQTALSAGLIDRAGYGEDVRDDSLVMKPGKSSKSLISARVRRERWTTLASAMSETPGVQ